MKAGREVKGGCLDELYHEKKKYLGRRNRFRRPDCGCASAFRFCESSVHFYFIRLLACCHLRLLAVHETASSSDEFSKRESSFRTIRNGMVSCEETSEGA